MVVGFTTTCAIGASHHSSCEFESSSWQGVLITTLIKFVSDLRQVNGFLTIKLTTTIVEGGAKYRSFNSIQQDELWAYDTPASRQTGSRNLTGQKTLPTIWGTYIIWSLWPNIRFLPSIVAEKNATKNGPIQNVCNVYKNQQSANRK